MILKQNRIGREGRVKNKASFFTRPFFVTGSFEEFPVTKKGTDIPIMRICGQTDANYRFFLKNSSAFRNMMLSASSFDIPFSRKYS